MGKMTLTANLANNGYVELTGSYMKYWQGEGLPTYEGEIEGAPQSVIDELLSKGLIKKSE